MSRSIKSVIAIAAVVVTLGLTAGPAAALTVTPNGGASGCCRIMK